MGFVEWIRYVEIQGVAPLASTVTVNSQLADRQGEYYRKELSVSTTSAAAYTDVTVSGTGLTSSAGKVFTPKDSVDLTYDASGNLTLDGRWDYTWDGENRLVKMVTRSSVAGISGFPFRRLEFVYDTQGRRIEKRVYNVASGGSEITHKKYLYDGWNLLMEVDAISSSNNVTYTWGLDLSGNDQGAGGVGGLLMIHDSTTHFVAMDGNGNVAALTDGAEVTGQYEYDPFGNLLRVTGSAGIENPFRFSTKYWDEETGLVYYGFRYYSPVLGRWVNRDPLSSLEEFFIPIAHSVKMSPKWLDNAKKEYAFVDNNPIGYFDYLGLCGETCGPDVTWWMKMEMYRNAGSEKTLEISKYNDLAELAISIPTPVSLNLFAYYKQKAWQEWAFLVGPGMDWDHKPEMFGLAFRRNCNTSKDCMGFLTIGENDKKCYSRDLPSNIIYGYVGKHAGFSDLELLGGASAAQFLHNVTKFKFDFDPYQDQEAIRVGIDFYQNIDLDASLNSRYKFLSTSKSEGKECLPCYERYIGSNN